MEMQIHIDSKCKFALDDITLWANRCTKNVNGNYHFTFSFGSAYVSEVNFHRELYSMTAAAFRHYF